VTTETGDTKHKKDKHNDRDARWSRIERVDLDLDVARAE
tara:strand:+ start:669 stop:785 length:117 start_codon:yes stop_codon:yes gene_type:complete